jgi:hypothetical protein
MTLATDNRMKQLQIMIFVGVDGADFATVPLLCAR